MVSIYLKTLTEQLFYDVRNGKNLTIDDIKDLLKSEVKNYQWFNKDGRWIVDDCLTCEELVGEVNHTTECVTDLFSFVDVEWTIMWSNSNYLDGNGYSENPTPQRKFEVGEVTVLKDAPFSVDLTMVPEVPTPTKV